MHIAAWSFALGLVALMVAGLVCSWRRPFVGLGVLVVGLAFHNFVLMALLALGLPNIAVHAIQGWKEAILALLTVVAVTRVARLRREHAFGSMLVTDWLAIGFAILCLVYFLVPPSVLGAAASLSQRLVGLRTLTLIPLLYFLGRALPAADDGDRKLVAYLMLGAAAAVSVFGLVELFAIPTSTWLDWGVNRYSSFLGFAYGGPQGLPENFFITLGDGIYARRMVSTYVSPLGIAYTALVIFPVAVVAMAREQTPRMVRILAVATALVMLGLALSVTRLAAIAMAGEAVLLTYLLRRWWIAAAVPLLAVAVVVSVFPYASIAPVVNGDLRDVAAPTAYHSAPGSDSSTQEHSYYFFGDLEVVAQHPLGLGTGASTIRFGKQLVSTGESAVLGVAGDLGVAGGLLYLVFFLLALWQGYRALALSRGGTLEDALPMVVLVGGLALVPISLTSDVWGDLSVTLPFWWSAGAAATLCAQRARREKRAPQPARARGWRISPG